MKHIDLIPATSRLHRTLLAALLWLAAWIGLCAPAQAGWEAYTNGEAGFGVPATYANMRKIDFETGGTTTASAYNTLTTEDTANRLLFTTPSSASWSETSTSSKTGMSNKKAYFQSTTSAGYKTLTIDFTNGGATGGTSYVAFMVHMGLKDQDGAYIKYNFSDGTSQTLYTCNSTTSGCIGAYVPSSFLTSLINLLTLCLLGCNQYDSVYMTYTPATSVKITSVVFGNGRCDGCGLLWSNSSQDMWIDNISYVDPTVVPHHLELTAASSTASSGSTTTFTIKACNNADCSELYTTGMSGTFSLTGTGLTPTYPGGQAYTIGARSATTTITASITPAGTATAALTSPSVTPSASPSVYCGMGVAAASGNSCNLTITQPLHHVRLTTSSSSALTCSPATYTITACANADCSTPYTGGLTGSLSVSGVTVNYPSGAAFSIGVGSSSTTVSAHMTSVGTGTASLTGLSAVPTNSPGTFCGMGVAAASGGSCAVSVASSALLLSIPAHYADASATATITAVKASDNSASCTPAFASVSKDVLFKCTYSNPGTGSLPVRMGGSALNATNSTSAACDGTGRSVSLSFDASGVATTTLQYADVGQVGVNATYTGSGSDAGLSMTGSTTFIAAPLNFVITGPGAGNIRAGNTFSATVYARNVSNATTPNFGREGTAEGVTLSFVRTHPSGTAAANGTFSGSVGAFTNGTASASNLTWNQVGKGDVVASLTDAGNDGYLASGLKSAGTTAGWTACAAEGGTCTLPSGATATVFYGANGFYKHVTGQTGAVSCSNGVFTDPIVGVGKNCYYVVTSGASPGGTGAVGPFIPYRFKTEVTNACGSFSYSGQPFTVKVTALSADGSTITTNYDGSANTSPNYAKVTTLSEATSSGTGSFSNNAIAVASYTAGVATVTTPTFTFTNKLTKPTAVTVRATDTDSVTSSGGTEGSLTLRSGRLKVSNAFGSEKSPLQIPVQAQYWYCNASNGCAWVLNNADSCTVIPTSAIARGNYVDHKGAATAAWTTTPSAAVSIGLNCSGSSTPGIGCLTLGAPSPAGSVGSVDFAFNLGATTSDASCLSTPRPSSTGANLSWFRSQYGSGNNCTDTTHTRDPSGRATFGVYSPESKKTVFTNDLY